ncbi:MAG: multiprotein-bridging factor 1 family protein [Flavobacteriales bacterium]
MRTAGPGIRCTPSAVPRPTGSLFRPGPLLWRTPYRACPRPSRFARELRALRPRLGLAQAEMAHRLHVAPSRISRWEQTSCRPLR